jgi:hypothetical protein
VVERCKEHTIDRVVVLDDRAGLLDRIVCLHVDVESRIGKSLEEQLERRYRLPASEQLRVYEVRRQ